VLAWLLGAGLGPAAVAVPVNWSADALAGAAQRWFKRLRRTDDMSRLVRAATGISVDLTHAEFAAVRKLLEDPQTWNVAGRGTVEDLADRIAACLPPRDGRTSEDSHAAALTIARGLLEFAAADLDPKLFRQAQVARLQRMETDQASALDEAMLDLHADLVARFASVAEQLKVMEQLKLVVDRLPPGPPADAGDAAPRDQVFISYSHADGRWLKELQIHLQPYVRHTMIAVWDDSMIRAGAVWKESIRQALDSAKGQGRRTVGESGFLGIEVHRRGGTPTTPRSGQE